MKTNISLIAKCVFLFSALVFISCGNNGIYFDDNDQSIRSCSQQVISNLLINGLDNKDFYHFSKKSNSKGTDKFSLVKLNLDYNLTGMFDKSLPLDSFHLQPNAEYEIENHSIGDAAGDKLLVKTDSAGIIIYANKTSCE